MIRVRGAWAVRLQRWTKYTALFAVGAAGAVLVAAVVVGTIYGLGHL